MKVISFVNQKGGVAKTTSTYNVAAALAFFGYNVGIIDLDPQCTLSSTLLGKGFEDGDTIYESIFDGYQEPDEDDTEVEKAAAIAKRVELPFYQVKEGVFVCPCSTAMHGFYEQATSLYEREKLLAKRIEKFKKKFDFILIDCKPSLDLLVVNALAASDYVMIPSTNEFFTYKSAEMLKGNIKGIRKELNRKLKVLGVFSTRVRNGKISKEIIQAYGAFWGDTYMESFIRESALLQESAIPKANGSLGTDVIEFKPKSIGAQDYAALTVEMLERMGFKIDIPQQ